MGYVYLIRNGGLHKIGITNDMQRRVSQLKPDEVVAYKYFGDDYRLIEKTLHDKYKHCRLPQSEYFRLSQEEIDEVRDYLNDVGGLNEIALDSDDVDGYIAWPGVFIIIFWVYSDLARGVAEWIWDNILEPLWERLIDLLENTFDAIREFLIALVKIVFGLSMVFMFLFFTYCNGSEKKDPVQPGEIKVVAEKKDDKSPLNPYSDTEKQNKSKEYKDDSNNYYHYDDKEVKLNNGIVLKTLNVTSYVNGEPIRKAQTSKEWKHAIAEKDGAYSVYNNGLSNVIFFNKYAVIDDRRVAPIGWHIPDEDEWAKIISQKEAIKQFFLPAGMRERDGDYSRVGKKGYYWVGDITEDPQNIRFDAEDESFVFEKGSLFSGNDGRGYIILIIKE